MPPKQRDRLASFLFARHAYRTCVRRPNRISAGTLRPLSLQRAFALLTRDVRSRFRNHSPRRDESLSLSLSLAARPRFRSIRRNEGLTRFNWIWELCRRSSTCPSTVVPDRCCDVSRNIGGFPPRSCIGACSSARPDRGSIRVSGVHVSLRRFHRRPNNSCHPLQPV